MPIQSSPPGNPPRREQPAGTEPAGPTSPGPAPHPWAGDGQAPPSPDGTRPGHGQVPPGAQPPWTGQTPPGAQPPWTGQAPPGAQPPSPYPWRAEPGPPDPRAPGPQGGWRRPEPAVSEQARSDALRWVRGFGFVLLAGLAVGLFALPWPWPLVAGALCLAAVVLGVVALVKVRAARIPGALTPVLVVGMVLAGMLALGSVSQAMLWREYDAYTGCLRSALTSQARDACEAELQRSLDERLERMQRELVPQSS
ncbi:hypothetical protein [Georgenia sp. AZ-5]|uniref:hypothetical protein n=1 Tax=Georgenia sp. AZ-5 TaxID=3367526 RepID=UPI0037542E76